MKIKSYHKRMRAVFLSVLLLACMLGGCGQENPASKSGAEGGAGSGSTRLQVVTTIFPQYDFARQIAGDRADVYMLLKPGEEVHSYEPTPQDIRMIQESGLFIYTGSENDVWVENILASLGEEGPETVRLLDLVDTYSEEQLEGMMPEKGGHDHDEDASGAQEDAAPDHVQNVDPVSVSESSDPDHAQNAETADYDHAQNAETASHEHPDEGENSATDTSAHDHAQEEEPDEHVWTSPANCVILIEKLTEKFCAADPANEEVYRANGDAYRADFEQLDREYREMAAAAPVKTILFGDRFPFRYLAEELDLTCYAAFSGCSSECEPSAATIAFLIDKAAQERLPAVFRIEFSNGNIAKAVAEAAQLRIDRDAPPEGTAAADGIAPRIQVLQLHSCHNVTRDEFSSGETCLSLMRQNLEALRIALQAPPGENTD